MKSSPVVALCLLLVGPFVRAEPSPEDRMTNDLLSYHRIRVTQSDHLILPWYSADLGTSYDHGLHLTWNFWVNMRSDRNGLPYFMNHQVWRPDFDDRRGVGGDQFAMALSSFGLLYAYTGEEMVKEEMKFIADYYLAHGLSPAEASWPHLPYPYNTLIYSGVYDGDMILGRGFTQPDKAGSLGWELVKLYKMTGIQEYLNAAVAIANTLAHHVQPGDRDHSPLPFKVNAVTGEVGQLQDNAAGPGTPAAGITRRVTGAADYTTNYAPTLELLLALTELKQGEVAAYGTAVRLMLNWMKEYPMTNNRWGPFFEDIPGWSDTQINAVTFARFILEHRELFPDWQRSSRQILDWADVTLGNDGWRSYGVRVINEQTAYQVPGNSHSSRQAATELLYAQLSGDVTRKANAIRQLSWATYMVADDGRNRYPQDEVWLTDGYGDYLRHYLRAMAAEATLAPAGQNHLLATSSVIQRMEYAPAINRFLTKDVPAEIEGRALVHYYTFDHDSTELLRLTAKPAEVRIGHTSLPEATELRRDSWSWAELAEGGLLKVHHSQGHEVTVLRK